MRKVNLLIPNHDSFASKSSRLVGLVIPLPATGSIPRQSQGSEFSFAEAMRSTQSLSV